jgi:hypothetical protein
MASRFVVADNNVIEELKTSSENSYTRKSTILWVGVFKKWAALAIKRNIDEWRHTRFKNLTSSQLTYEYILPSILTSNRTVPRKIKV